MFWEVQMTDEELSALGVKRSLETAQRDAERSTCVDLTVDEAAALEARVARKVAEQLAVFQAEEKASFIAQLLEHGNIARAAAACGISRRAALAARHRDPEFAAAWADALEAKVDDVQQVMLERAMNPSTAATVAGIFVLKHLRPEVFSEQREHEAQRPQVVVVNLLRATSEQRSPVQVLAAQDTAFEVIDAEHDGPGGDP